MERKRKLPARAASRPDGAAKKRNITPLEERSVTPAPVEEPPPPLPKSVEPGKPLPTVEEPQPISLPLAEFQSLQESNVLNESLQRSRQIWVGEGVFERYWTKPVKKRGILKEPPNNPPKDGMTRLGQVTIAVGPQIFEAIMYAVKDPKPPPPLPANVRPVVQYGPAPTPPASASTTPGPTSVPPITSATSQPATLAPPSTAPPQISRASSGAPSEPAKSVETPRGAVPADAAPGSISSAQPSPAGSLDKSTSTNSTDPSSAKNGPAPVRTTPAPATTAPRPTGPAAAKPAGSDPIIVTLAERAAEDQQLRDLMKRVAVGQADTAELAHFQKIIDQITREYRQKGGQQGPSADRLLVDGRTVKFLADEVKTILDIILRSNPKEKSSTLRPPVGTDPLILALVKIGLDDEKTRDMVKRVADGKPGFTDATDLKEILDKLHKDLKAAKVPPAVSTLASPATNGHTNGRLVSPQTATTPVATQALRSKGPPPAPKPDISAVVFEFVGGSGDRFLFPKYSILEYLPGGQQVIASFLIVQKGSRSEYGCDPSLDYYERITVRLYSTSAKQLENLARVVAPPDEVRRYMNGIMESATRAEYILLAMRLPRGGKDGGEKDEDGEETGTSRSTPKAEAAPSKQQQQASATNTGVLWTLKARSQSPSVMAKGTSKDGGDKIFGIPPLKPRYQPRESSPPVFSLRKGLNGYSDAEAERYNKMTQALAQKEAPEV